MIKKHREILNRKKQYLQILKTDRVMSYSNSGYYNQELDRIISKVKKEINNIEFKHEFK